ncbi:hypothetical protein IFR05_015444 [Cadophora sp. M221]|nr:hypothetical protein IFR05_015444 [Cadophora sp. M221]
MAADSAELQSAGADPSISQNYRGPKQQFSKRLLDANLEKAHSDGLALTERNGNEGGEGWGAFVFDIRQIYRNGALRSYYL